MTTVADGFATGRKSKTYYNTGTRASPVWVEITRITKENFDPGEQDFMQSKARDLGRDLQEEDSCKPAQLTFTRLVPKGTDAVFTALLASYGYQGTVYEFAVVDDDITYNGARYSKFFGKVSKLPVTRDVGAFTEQSWEVKEIVHYESSALCALLTGTIASSSSSP
jgi:hypothetical protein